LKRAGFSQAQAIAGANEAELLDCMDGDRVKLIRLRNIVAAILQTASATEHIVELASYEAY